MTKTLTIAAALLACSLLGACGGGADSGVDVRPQQEIETVPDPSIPAGTDGQIPTQ